MKNTKLAFVGKGLFLSLAALGSAGCVQVTMEEKLNLDGSSELVITSYSVAEDEFENMFTGDVDTTMSQELTEYEKKMKCWDEQGEDVLTNAMFVSCEVLEGGGIKVELKRNYDPRRFTVEGDDLIYGPISTMEEDSSGGEFKNKQSTAQELRQAKMMGISILYELESPWPVEASRVWQQRGDLWVLDLLEMTDPAMEKIRLVGAAKDVKLDTGLSTKIKEMVLGYLKQKHDDILPKDKTDLSGQREEFQALATKFQAWAGEDQARQEVADFAVVRIGYVVDYMLFDREPKGTTDSDMAEIDEMLGE